MAVDLVNYAHSFASAIIKVDDRQFSGIRSVNINQNLNEGVVFGTGIGPLKRTLGQLQMGQGQLIFSDYEDGTDFFAHLAPQPLTRMWTLDYVTQSGQSIRNLECRSCRLLGLGVEHESGAEALGITYPFSFMALRIDGLDMALTPNGVAQAAIGIAQNLVNLT